MVGGQPRVSHASARQDAIDRGVAQILAAGKASTTPTFRFREKQRLAGYALAVALAPLLTVLFAILRGDRG